MKTTRLPRNKEGVTRTSKAAKVIIDAVIVGQATEKQSNLSMAYIDYMKAYDSVPHSYLLKVLGSRDGCPGA